MSGGIHLLTALAAGLAAYANGPRRETPRRKQLMTVLESAPPVSMPLVEHGSLLPRSLTARMISAHEKVALAFILDFLHDCELPAALFLSGGYVRDLLLGEQPNDLDVSLCLRDCEPDVTIGSIVDQLPDFAVRRPDLGVSSVEITTALSETSRGKRIDTAKVRMAIWGQHVMVDLLPTIGSEKYDECDRVPFRNVRGSPQQDALRRDLTIGAMFLLVTRTDRNAALSEVRLPLMRSAFGLGAATSWETVLRRGESRPPALFRHSSLRTSLRTTRRVAWTEWQRVAADGPEGTMNAAPSRASSIPALSFRLLDYYGGLDDLRLGILRSPYPRGRSFESVWDEVMVTPAERNLAAQLGIGFRLSRFPPVWVCGAHLAATSVSLRQAIASHHVCPVPSTTDAADIDAADPEDRSGLGGGLRSTESDSGAISTPDLIFSKPRDAPLSVNQESMLQAVWWVKVLRDDPLRVVRALRFCAKLRFKLHEAFWRALPFALYALQTKVAGERKGVELRKLARSGRQPLLTFFELAFGTALRTPLVETGSVANDVDIEAAAEAEVAAAGAATTTAAATAAASGLRSIAPALVCACNASASELELFAPEGFSVERFRHAALGLPEALDADSLIGALLGAALLSCSPAMEAEEALVNALQPPSAEQLDADALAATTRALVAARRSCLVLQATGQMRHAAETPLLCLERLLAEQPAVTERHKRFAFVAGIDVEEFAALVHMWEVLRLDPANRREHEHPSLRTDFVLALARTRCSSGTSTHLAKRLTLLLRTGPIIGGKAVATLEQVPPCDRSEVIAHLHVLGRLRGETLCLSEPRELRKYLDRSGHSLPAEEFKAWP